MKRLNITDKILDKLGFSEYWDEHCTWGGRTLTFSNGTRFRIIEQEEMDDDTFYYMIADAFLRPIPFQYHSFGMILGNEMRKRSFWEKPYGKWKFPFKLRDKFFSFDKEEKIS